MRAKVLECLNKSIVLNVGHCKYEFWPHFVIDLAF